MKVLDLRCSGGHAFEGWFASEAAYRDQQARSLVACPLCGDAEVTKLPSAPRLNIGRTAAPPKEGAGQPISADGVARTALSQPAAAVPTAASAPTESALPDALRAAIWQAARTAFAQAEDVGPAFAHEARRMHRGETPERGIRGQASRAEALALRQEGVAVLPVPDFFKEPLQ